jgi:hypothetical protein
MVSKNRGLLAFNLIWLWHAADRLSAAYAEVAKLVRRPPLVGERFPFDGAPEAMRAVQSGRTAGKVVLEVR